MEAREIGVEAPPPPPPLDRTLVIFASNSGRGGGRVFTRITCSGKMAAAAEGRAGDETKRILMGKRLVEY